MKEKRECRYCHKRYPIDHFEIANIINGKKYRRWKCKKCYVARKSERRREIKRWLVGLKKTMKCQECGNSDYRVLDFHHNNLKKEFNISDGMRRGLSKERLEKEIGKCKTLCSNCHRILHYEEDDVE